MFWNAGKTIKTHCQTGCLQLGSRLQLRSHLQLGRKIVVYSKKEGGRLQLGRKMVVCS